MKLYLLLAARTVGLAFATLLTACGGGGGADPSPTTAASTEVVAQSPDAQARLRPAAAMSADAIVARSQGSMAPLLALPAVNVQVPATTLTVRAHGTLAGDVGPKMRVRVDGVVVGEVEVRATQPTDHRFDVPALQPGAEVDVAFINDGNIDGADRNLFVSYLIAGDTYLLSTSPGVFMDRGNGDAAFDGIDVHPGSTGLYSNSALRFLWPEPNLTDRVTVRASARLAANVGADMQLRVDGVTVGSVEVRNTQPADHTFAVPTLVTGSRVDVVFANGATVDGAARELKVDYLLSGTTVLMPDAAGVTIDLGTGTAAFDGSNVQPGQGHMTASGALRGRWPAPNMTDSLTVRASGSLAADTGPLMQVRVNGIVVGTTEVRATTPTDYNFAIPPLQAGDQVETAFINDAVVNGADRNLRVNYLIAGSTYLLPSMPGVTYDIGAGEAAFDGVDALPGQTLLNRNGALRADWPDANLTDRLTVNARGQSAGGVAPIMEAWVDGVRVGSVDVMSTTPVDHVFAVPAMSAGRKLDIVFVNDRVVAGVDRNLYVSYMIAGNTVVLPNAPIVSYDRGEGNTAFDGASVVPGQEVMYWAGALRLSWPVPNITDSLTVRASGSLAGSIGPLMQIRVDGITVSTVEVRATTPSDYVMPVTPLRAGSRIDVVFANDAIIDGADRNLRVDYLLAGSTYAMPTSPGASYDIGSGAAAFDGTDVVPGQSLMGSGGALRMAWPGENITETITVRASGSVAGGVGPLMQLRVDGVTVGTHSVTSSTMADYVFSAPRVAQGSHIDVVFINDGVVDGQDRNLYVQYVKAGGATLASTAHYASTDNGNGEAAFDGISTAAGTGNLYSNGAIRFIMPALPSDASLGAQHAASRFLQQASFGPTPGEVSRLISLPFETWISEQMALPASAGYVADIEARYALGAEYRPKGSLYTPNWIGQRFWANAATAPDQLRQRVALALHQIFVVSQADSNLGIHSRAYANYLDTLNRHAFGNFRNLLQDIALSPVMGVYLSHMRNRPEDPSSGRLPDENFARELMQLFSIGLHELNSDGTPKLDTQGQPIETYDNDDVMAMAKVFTGFSWAFPDDQLTEENFRWKGPDYSAGNDLRIDLLPMKPYPGQHSAAEKRLFAGTSREVVIAANGTAEADVRQALDALFGHPNVGPFIGRQMIQRLVTSHPSPAYVARVAAKFNNNGAGVRGDLAAVVRAVLMDSEARTAPASDVGKLREPVLRVAHWMRSFGATSASGEYMIAGELANQSQRAMYAPSVFGYFRPGYVPPNTVFSAGGVTLPELQIVDETSTARWVNLAWNLAGSGIGRTNNVCDVSSTLAPLVALASAGNFDGIVQQLDVLLYAGRMSSTLRQDLIDAMTRVSGNTEASQVNRARVALFLALAAPEYLVQR